MSTATAPVRQQTFAEAEALRHRQLTPRELEVVQLVADGEDCKNAAARLGLCVGTLKNLRHTAMLKLGADGPAHMVALAFRRGMIS